MQQKFATRIALATVFLLAGAHLCPRADARSAAMHNKAAQGFARAAAPLVLAQAQNPFGAFSLPEMPEPPISPINPGTLPGTSSGPGTGSPTPFTSIYGSQSSLGAC